MKRLHFLVNSRAGRGRATKAWHALEAYLQSLPSMRAGEVHTSTNNSVPADDSSSAVVYTVSDATDITFDYGRLTPDTVLVAVGGDGSVHHAAAQAVRHNLLLGIIPAGTGNDYATMLGLPEDPIAALRLVLDGSVRLLDVIWVDKELLINAGGFGLDASVVHYIEKHPWLKRLGSLGYSISLPVVLGRYQPYSVTIQAHAQSRHYEQVSLLAITNGPSFGGGMRVVPGANATDGQLEVCVVSKLSKLSLLALFPRIFRGTHITHPSVHIHRGDAFAITMQRLDHHGELDGEPIEVANEVTIRMQAAGLRVLAGE
ncbi:MAG: hypothetical protein A2201_07545 [Alicyclobacillus sp. RIFOXYA1_FULL_53_8]|nr:MAG: hypothetical protein A2201_07545 [Alicyclobacillus sp. RIFOXYA1_FULL_53_8]